MLGYQISVESEFNMLWFPSGVRDSEVVGTLFEAPVKSPSPQYLNQDKFD